MRDDEEFKLPVVTNWDELSSCMFARKEWVNHQNIDQSKSYEKGDFLRVFCDHDGCWCQAENGLDGCQTYLDHEAE